MKRTERAPKASRAGAATSGRSGTSVPRARNTSIGRPRGSLAPILSQPGSDPENWRSVLGFPAYEVSRDWQVRSLLHDPPRLLGCGSATIHLRDQDGGNRTRLRSAIAQRAWGEEAAPGNSLYGGPDAESQIGNAAKKKRGRPAKERCVADTDEQQAPAAPAYGDQPLATSAPDPTLDVLITAYHTAKSKQRGPGDRDGADLIAEAEHAVIDRIRLWHGARYINEHRRVYSVSNGRLVIDALGSGPSGNTIHIDAAIAAVRAVLGKPCDPTAFKKITNRNTRAKGGAA